MMAKGVPSGAFPSRRQGSHSRSHLLVGDNEIKLHLEIQPEQRFDTEPVTEAQSSIAIYRTLTRNNLANAIRRHINLACNRRWGYPKFHRRAAKTTQNVQIAVLKDRVVFDVEDIASSPFTLYIFDPHPKTYTTDPQSKIYTFLA